MRNLRSLAVLIALTSSSLGHAAAYYVGEIGARSVARGGANLVSPTDPSAAWLNPAALSLAPGLQLDVDVNLVFLSSSFTRDCGGKPNGCAAPAGGLHKAYKGTDGTPHNYDVVDNRPGANAQAQPGAADVKKLGNLGTPSRFDGVTPTTNKAGPQPIPRIMLSLNGDTFGVDGIALGAYVYAPNNGDYDFGEDTPTRYTLINRDLLEVYYGIALAYRAGDALAVGAGLQFVTAGLDQTVRLSADQYGNEDPNQDIQIRVTGRQDFIPSGNFGVWSNPGKLLGIGDLEVAGSIQLGRTVKAVGPVKDVKTEPGLQPLIDAGQLSIDAKKATATAEFTLAPFYRAGLKYGAGDDGFAWDVEADFVYEQWSVYDHVFLATKNAKVSLGGAAPKELDPVVQPKDWVDAWSVRVGGTAALWQRALEIHAGGFYESSGIPNATYSIELADGDKIGVGAGVSGKLAGVRLDLAYSHILVLDRVIGPESIVYDGSSGPSVFMTPDNAPAGTIGGADTRTRVAMGKYSAGFDMINASVTVAFDEAFGFGAAHHPSGTAP